MGRKPQWPPRVKPHPQSGQDRVRHLGQTYYLGPIGSAESRRRYVELLAELSPPEGRGKAAWPSVAELALRWRVDRGPSHTGQERASYERALEVFCGSGRDALPADRVTAAVLGKARQDMVALGWCRNVANRQTVRVCTVWRWAEESGLAPPGSWHHLRSLRPLSAHDRSVRHTEPVRPASWEELQLVLSRLRSAPVKAMLLFQWWTGARGGEARRLRACDLDRSGDVWAYRPASHKNAWRGHRRVVPVGPEAQSVLAPFLPGEGELFRTRAGAPFTSEAYGSMVGRAAKKAGLPWFRPLCCRHSFRVRATREVGLDCCREMMGHASPAMTLRYGGGQDVNAAMEGARKVG